MTRHKRDRMSSDAGKFSAAAARPPGRRPGYDGAMSTPARPAPGGPQLTRQITSPANPRVKQIIALRRRRAREAAGVILVEGRQELELALGAGVRPQALYWCPELAGPDALVLVGEASRLGAEVISVSSHVFGKIAYRESPDGWLALVPQVRTDLERLQTGHRPLLLVCQGVEKPGNLGAMLRTADAAGATALIAADPVTDWGNPNVVRASKGTLFCVPVASAASDTVLGWLRARAVPVIAATPVAGLVLTEADLAGPAAIVVGSETAGLPDLWLSAADVRVRIPMFGRADSLNVATSAAILMYEAVRQRASARS
jgi:RNA methyltransferase, TrmH family